jgi:hypothetical protein
MMREFWRQQKIEITTTKGKEFVTGWLHEGGALSLTPVNVQKIGPQGQIQAWTITHVPSGLYVWAFWDWGQAKKAVDGLVLLGDWSTEETARAIGLRRIAQVCEPHGGYRP